MARIKLEALLEQGKKKVPGRISPTTIIFFSVIIFMAIFFHHIWADSLYSGNTWMARNTLFRRKVQCSSSYNYTSFPNIWVSGFCLKRYIFSIIVDKSVFWRSIGENILETE